MLEVKKVYRNREGDEVAIGGRVKEYPKLPYVWSYRGDWYHETSGDFIVSKPLRDGESEPERYPAPNNYRSIKDHTAIDQID